jgi:hypothetical protein
MKMQKVISLDESLIKLLSSESNASAVISALLMDYYRESPALQSEEIAKKIREIQQKIDENQIILCNLQEKLTKIKKKEIEITAIFKEIPQEILNDFKIYPEMTEEILKSRYKDIYSQTTKLKFEQILTAFNQYFNKK